MFRASDIFGRKPGDKSATSQAAPASSVARSWDPATGQYNDEEIPEDIQEMMGVRKRPEPAEEQPPQQVWSAAGALPRPPSAPIGARDAPYGQHVPRKVPRVITSTDVGYANRVVAPPPIMHQRTPGPVSEAERTAPSVEYKGFSKVDLDERYYERTNVVVHGRSTYWSTDGQFFIYWQGEVQRWSICDTASFESVKAGQLPGWAYKEDHKPLCQASGWMEAWNGQWRSPDLEVKFRSSSQNSLQWEDVLLQKTITAVEFTGFAMKELNATYFLKTEEMIQGKPSFWDDSGVYFAYWQSSTSRWAICDLKCLDAVKAGQCPGWAFRNDTAFFANAAGWQEMRNGDWATAEIETIVHSTSTKGIKVSFAGFSRADLNTTFTERPDEEVQGKPTFWDPSGTYFLYWQESMKRWAILDKVSLHLAKSGLAPGWAYRTDSQHFARASSWMEAASGKDWQEANIQVRLLEGVVREELPPAPVKAEANEDAGMRMTADQYKSLVRVVYERQNPDKLKDLPAIFKRFVGREADLFAQVCAKYSVDQESVAAELPQPEAIQEAQKPANQDEFAHLEHAEVPELKASEYAVMVQSAYEQFNPTKLKDMGRLLKKFQGRERELFLEVCKKYGAHAAKFHAKWARSQAAQGAPAEDAMAKPV